MTENIFISLQKSELQDLIRDCVSACFTTNLNHPASIGETEQLLTIKQAAELLNLSVPTIYGKVSRSEIPVCKQGNRLYFLKPQLVDWIKQGKKKTTDEISAISENYLINKNKKGGK